MNGKLNVGELIKTGIILFLITALSAALLAYVNGFTAPMIAKNKETKTQDAMRAVLPAADSFEKKSKCTRLIRGRLDLTDGTVRMRLTQYQGNVIISSMIGCNVFAVIPAGSGRIEKGTVLKGFMI